MNLSVFPCNSFNFVSDKIASDKSISHRCALFSLLSPQPSVIRNYLQAEDTLCTLDIVQALGASVTYKDDAMYITPPHKIVEPPCILDCGNSGTAIRLLMGFLAGIDGFFVLFGDKYLAQRPMRRIANPLRSIGASIDGRCDGEYAPLSIRGQKLKAFHYESPIASAQVKSALLLAGLHSDGTCSFVEPHLSRDHSENMLKGMGLAIQREGTKITFQAPMQSLKPLDITVPNDPSSGFFFALAAAIVPNAQVTLKNMLLNPTRIEAYKILQKMGTHIEFITTSKNYEEVGDIVVRNAPLKSVQVSENIAWLIDELPALSIAFACANGVSIVKNAAELRVKESDRIASVVKNLQLCGINVREFEDGYEIQGGALRSATIESFGDHRIAMSFAIAGLIVPMQIQNVACVQTSFPNFIDLLAQITTVKSYM
ncbi:MAG: 3-phosphoshikimate 1-carboxyvinyltransferase [Sulfurospirillum sp.]|nr:3-phosphoshikimate 1-carboxyvinyltransferase [Sulfurospirillum sp.]